MGEKNFWQFAQLLEKLRNEQGLNKASLAARAGLNPCHITRLESGMRRPSRETVQKLGSALGLGPSDVDQMFLAAGHAPMDVDRLLSRQAETDRKLGKARQRVDNMIAGVVVAAQRGGSDLLEQELIDQIRLDLRDLKRELSSN